MSSLNHEDEKTTDIQRYRNEIEYVKRDKNLIITGGTKEVQF